VRGVLSSQGIVVHEGVMGELSKMEEKVGRMKHRPGVRDDEFVSAAEYEAAVAAIEGFWEFLGENERGSTS
jgi:hypothetical protein